MWKLPGSWSHDTFRIKTSCSALIVVKQGCVSSQRIQCKKQQNQRSCQTHIIVVVALRFIFFGFLDVRRELFLQKARRPKDERDDYSLRLIRSTGWKTDMPRSTSPEGWARCPAAGRRGASRRTLRELVDEMPAHVSCPQPPENVHSCCRRLWRRPPPCCLFIGFVSMFSIQLGVWYKSIFSYTAGVCYLLSYFLFLSMKIL